LTKTTRHRVDLVVTGHEHAYERVHPNVAGKDVMLPTNNTATSELEYRNPTAPVHLMVGR
jgi:hypothetical protein